MAGLLGDRLTALHNDLAMSRRTLAHSSPQVHIRNMRQRIDDINNRLAGALGHRFVLLRERLEARSRALEAASPRAILAKGYARVYRTFEGTPVRATDDAEPGAAITIELHDGDLKARVEDESTHEQYRRTLF